MSPRDSDITASLEEIDVPKTHKSEPLPLVPAVNKRTAPTSTLPVKKLKATTEDGKELTHLDYRHVPSTWLNKDSKHSGQPASLQLSHHKGDMFADAPKGCVLIHACNTQGHWGAGIAKEFKQKYPKVYTDHHKFCADDHSKSDPVPTGTAQLLAPRDGAPELWIGCVFTSAKYGKGKDKPDQIIKNTATSVQMLLQLISMVAEEITSIRMCRINSGKFGVPWEKTERVLKGLDMQPWWPKEIEVWVPEE